MPEGNALWALNILISVVIAGLAWWNTTMWGEIKESRRRGHDLAGEVAKLQVFVAGSYATREELRDSMREMTAAVTSRLDKLDAKMDSQLGDLYDELKQKADK